MTVRAVRLASFRIAWSIPCLFFHVALLECPESSERAADLTEPSCARTPPSAPGQDGTGSHPGRQCVCLATPVPFRALNPHGSLGRQRFQAHHPQRRGCGLRFLDLTLPLTIGAGPHQSRPNPEARVCEKADPPLHAQGPDHLDRSTAIVLTLNAPCRRSPRPALR